MNLNKLFPVDMRLIAKTSSVKKCGYTEAFLDKFAAPEYFTLLNQCKLTSEDRKSFPESLKKLTSYNRFFIAYKIALCVFTSNHVFCHTHNVSFMGKSLLYYSFKGVYGTIKTIIHQ